MSAIAARSSSVRSPNREAYPEVASDEERCEAVANRAARDESQLVSDAVHQELVTLERIADAGAYPGDGVERGMRRFSEAREPKRGERGTGIAKVHVTQT